MLDVFNLIAQTVEEWYAVTGQIGLFIIFFVIGVPVGIAILLSLLSKPRNLRVSILLLLGLGIIVIIFISLVLILGAVVSIFIP